LVYDGICFFISKKDEYVLAYIDSNSNSKSIIFYDINNNNEIKKFNNAHEKSIHIIKYYEYELYDIILTSSTDVKLWNYNESLNILTISNIFNQNMDVYSSALLFDNNSFYILCVGDSDYIKIYNSSGNFYKNIGNNNEGRRYIDIIEINENKYIISGSGKGLQVFNYPLFTDYYCFKEENYGGHYYAKIIKNNNIYNLIDVGNRKIRIWDFYKKNLIRSISSNNNSFQGFIVINNKYLIIGSYKEINEFDITNGLLVKSIKNELINYVLGIKTLMNKKNENFFVSYGTDKNIYLWKLK